jgi:hypothetical protein
MSGILAVKNFLFLVMLAIAGALCGCGESVSYSGPMTINAPQQGKDSADVAAVTFTLLRKPSIEKERGQMHSGPRFGENRYEYAGKLAFDGTEAKLASKFHPIALYKSGGTYFLLGQYWFNHESFRWYTLEADSFQEISFDKIPPALWAVHPADKHTSALFRFWTISQLLERTDIDAAAKCFSNSADEDPHFAYEQNAAGNERRYTTLPDVLDQVRDRKADGFYTPLLAVLNSATRADDPQDVGLVAYTVKELKPNEGMDAVEDFIRRVKAEGGEGDPRISDLEWRLKPQR